MKVLITGGAGYVGNHLCDYYLNKNHEVTSLDIIKNSNKFINNIECDILDYNKLEEIFSKNSYDLIIHSCAKVPISKLTNSFDEINYNGTRNILNIYKKYKIKKFIFISSSAVYGIPRSVPITEESERNPVEKYGLSKKKAEDLCLELSKFKNIIIIRPRTIIGEGRLGIMSFLFDWISSNLPVPVLNNGDNLYQFIDIRDLVTAIYKSSFVDYTGSLNIGASNFTTIRDLVSKLIYEHQSNSKIKNLDNRIFMNIAKLFKNLRIIPLKDYHFKAYGADLYFDNSKAKKVLDWDSNYTNYSSLKNSYVNYLKKDSNNVASPHKKRLKNFIIKYSTLLI